MTWDRRLVLLRLWLHLNGLLVGLVLGGLLTAAICVVVYLPFQKPTVHEGVVEGFGFIDSEDMGRLPTLWVKLNGGRSVSVTIRRGVICRKGDRITLVHVGLSYRSGVTGCRRPTLSEQTGPR
ncbi:MAG: hypothetical protein EON95_02620 [Caulobacteraceae bacterium]|nr:MAG: hypothetical protein EON95_02620 [Caulobacteraceae bacterium]